LWIAFFPGFPTTKLQLGELLLAALPTTIVQRFSKLELGATA